MNLNQIFRIPKTLTIYVDNQRTDFFVPDGSIHRPYSSLKSAIESIIDASSNKRYAILVKNGFYYEDNPITLKSYVFVQGDFKHNPRIIPNNNNQPLFQYPDGYTSHDFGELTFIAPTNNSIFSATGENAHAIGGFYYCLFIAPEGAGNSCEAFHHETTSGGFHLVNCMVYSEHWTGAKFGIFANMKKGNYRDTGMHIHADTIMDSYLKQSGEGHSEIDLLLTDTNNIGKMIWSTSENARLMISNIVSSNPGDCSISALYIEKGELRVRNSDLWGICYFGEDSNISIQSSEFLNGGYVEGYKPSELIVTQCKNIKSNGYPETCACYCLHCEGDNTRIHTTGNSFVSPAGCEPVQLSGTFVSIEAQGVSQYDVESLAYGESKIFEHLPDLSYARVVQISRYNSGIYNELDFDLADEGNYYQENTNKTEFVDGKVKLEIINPTTPYGHWHLNELSGTTVEDSSGNDRDGTTNNMEDSDWVTGKLNNCLYFDGVDEYVSFEDIAGFERTDSFSFNFWFKTSGSINIMDLISRIQTIGNERGYSILMETTGQISVLLQSSSGTSNYIKVITDDSFNDNQWYNISISYNGSSDASGIVIYVNTIQVSTTTISNNLTGTIVNAIPFQFSSRNSSTNFYNGYLDEVIIYEKVLSEEEIIWRYNEGIGIETDKGYDISKGWYVRTDSNSIDTSSWYNIGKILITQTTPTGTDIRYLFSINGNGSGTSWKKWNGIEWETIDLANIDTQGMTKSQVESLTDSQWGTLFVGGSGSTFDIVVSLKTSDETVTPEIDIISIIYLTGSRYLSYDDDIKVEFLDDIRTQITNTINPPETLYGLKVNIFMLTPF